MRRDIYNKFNTYLKVINWLKRPKNLCFLLIFKCFMLNSARELYESFSMSLFFKITELIFVECKINFSLLLQQHDI